MGAKLVIPPFLQTLEWREVHHHRIGSGHYENFCQIIRTPIYGDDSTFYLNSHLAAIAHMLEFGVGPKTVRRPDGLVATFCGGARRFQAVDGERALRYTGVYLPGRALIHCHDGHGEFEEWLSDVGLLVEPR